MAIILYKYWYTITDHCKVLPKFILQKYNKKLHILVKKIKFQFRIDEEGGFVMKGTEHVSNIVHTPGMWPLMHNIEYQRQYNIPLLNITFYYNFFVFISMVFQKQLLLVFCYFQASSNSHKKVHTNTAIFIQSSI